MDAILSLCLEQRITNTFELIAWWNQQKTNEEILAILKGRLQTLGRGAPIPKD